MQADFQDIPGRGVADAQTRIISKVQQAGKRAVAAIASGQHVDNLQELERFGLCLIMGADLNWSLPGHTDNSGSYTMRISTEPVQLVQELDRLTMHRKGGTTMVRIGDLIQAAARQ